MPSTVATRALTRALRHLGGRKAEGEDETRWQHLAGVIWAKALGGNLTAIRLVAEYCEGRPIAMPRVEPATARPIHLTPEQMEGIVAQVKRWEQERDERAPA